MFEGLDAATATPLVLALAAFLGALTATVKLCSPEVVKLIGAIREALTVRAIVKTADAHAQRLSAEEKRLEAEERRIAAENTGKFIAASTADGEQIKSLLTEALAVARKASAEIEECRAGRAAERLEREEERKKHRAEMAAIEDRLAQVESGRAALWKQLQKLQHEIESGIHGDPRRELDVGAPAPRKES